MAHIEDDQRQRVRYVSVIPKIIAGVCPKCGELCEDVHQKREREVVDLPFGGFQTKLRVRFYQFTCSICSKFFTQNFKEIASGVHATERFLERAAEMIKYSDIKSTSQFFQVSESNLGRWYYEYVKRKQDMQAAEAKPIRAIGIDELSLKKSIDNSVL